MSRMITATGMALLSIGVVVSVQAQPVSVAGQVTLESVTTPAATDAVRRKGPKVKVKDATGRVANPATATGLATQAQTGTPVAPEAARTGRPKIKTKTATDTSRVVNPAPVAVPVAPISAPEAARTGRPKEKEKEATSDSVANPSTTTNPTAPETERTGRPKERDDSVRTHTKRSRATTPSRGSNLLLPALGGAAAIAAIVVATSENDKPSST